MVKKIILDEEEYEFDKLSDQGKAALQSLQFIDKHLQELSNMNVIIKRAKNSYIKSLTQEMLSEKVGLLFEDD